MGTGDKLWVLKAKGSTPPMTAYAVPEDIPDASTPNLLTRVLQFDPSSDESADWVRTVPPQYAGGGFKVRFKGGTDNTSTGQLDLGVRMLPIADAAVLTADLGIDGQTRVSVTDTPPATPANKLNYSAQQTLSHSNAGSPSAGDTVVIRATRNSSDGNSGFLSLEELEIEEA